MKFFISLFLTAVLLFILCTGGGSLTAMAQTSNTQTDKDKEDPYPKIRKDLLKKSPADAQRGASAEGKADGSG